MNTIHVHASGEAGIYSNAFLVESERGVVAIDATLTVSESQAFRRRIDEIGKPLLGVLITHAHPDHVAGLTHVVKGSVPIFALRSVESLMRKLEAPKRAQWKPVFKDDWIDNWVFPDQIVSDRQVVTLEGNQYRVYDLGAGGDCDANSIWTLDGAAFVGDLVFNQMHSYIADGHVAEWYANLERATSWLSPDSVIYPGHGPAGKFDLLLAQKRYLDTYCAGVRELSEGRPTLTDSEKQELVSRMTKAYPGAGLGFMISLSADAVAKELSAKHR